MIRERFLQVLRYLASNQPASKYQMEKHIRPEIDHATLHEVVSYLKEFGFIRVVRTEKFRIPSLKVEYYVLGLRGLMAVIQEEPLNVDLDQIAEKQRDLLPLILGKWKLFIESGWQPHFHLTESCMDEYDAIDILEDILESRKPKKPNVSSGEEPWKTDQPRSERRTDEFDLESYLRDCIYDKFFFLEPEYAEIPAPLWIKAWKKDVYNLDRILVNDHEIFNWVMKRLQKRMRKYSEYQSLLRERKKNLETFQTATKG